MTNKVTRRDFTKLAAAAGAAAAAAPLGSFAYAQGVGKVVVIGGGSGGATVAHLVKKQSPNLDVILVEANKTYTTCFFSNLYLGGFRTFESITHNYDGLTKLGVVVVNAWATGVNTTAKTVALAGGGSLSYDKLVLSPGIDFKWETVAGLDAKSSDASVPHAFVGGAQTKLLKAQLGAMKDGGVFVICSPPNPMRCPPGTGERISMVANYFKKSKPKSKIILLDPKSKFSKFGLFRDAWKRHYGGMIDQRLSNEIDKNGAASVDVATKVVTTAGGDQVKADVLNVIPAMKAGKIAFAAGVTKGDWCPVDPSSFASKMAKDVYVLGDSSAATKMPKSGFSANSQAAVVANAVQASFGLKPKFPATYNNTCWSLVNDNEGIKVFASYKAGATKVDKTGGGISKNGETAAHRLKTYQDSLSWYTAMTNQMFAKG